MRKFTLQAALAGVLLAISLPGLAQQKSVAPQHRCATQDAVDELIRKDPSIVNRWKAEGERQYAAYLQRVQNGTLRLTAAGDTIVIPVVFHLVGTSTILNAIPDRDIYEQIEILNRDYNGLKADQYKGLYAPELEARVGRIPVKFVLARRTPGGLLTNGIERLASAATFTSGTIANVKSTANGGLDPWDVNTYLNIWCATFTDGLLGIATFPFMNQTDIGPHGVAIDLVTLGANPCRGISYYPTYIEGATLSHEVGHYLYLFHTFGDQSTCNNADFRIQTGWPLPATAVDDTPPEKSGNSTMFGNPSSIYTDGCSSLPYGMMYQNYMNYYDDRALFMFSAGQKERVLGTLNQYRTGLATSLGATPPSAVADAYLVSITPFGKCDTRLPVVNNTPVKATIRNLGTTTLTSVTVNIKIDAAAATATVYPLTLAAGRDTVLTVGTVTAAMGAHTVTVYTTAPNGNTDNFKENDTLASLVNVRTNTATAPLTENFTGTSFPPILTAANDYWAINNLQSATWTRSATAGYTAAGAATVQNFNYNGPGQLDELITPPIIFGSSDSSLLTFKVAYGRFSNNVYDWDGLEVYVSGNGGQTYNLVYKKTGNNLQTVAGTTGNVSFNPLVDVSKWRSDTINLTPYIIAGQPMIIKFRNVNAFGNNLYLDDIGVSAANLPNRDAFADALLNVPDFLCTGTTNSITPTLRFGSKGSTPITSLKINYRIDNGAVTTLNWTGLLNKGDFASFALGAINNIPAGNHVLTVYTSEPNGLNDNTPTNDTLRKTIVIFVPVDAPVKEGFESGTFPPSGWSTRTGGTTTKWSKTTRSTTESTGAAWVKSYGTNSSNEQSDLVAPIVKTGVVDSVYIKFDVSHATRVYPGSTSSPMDTLEVLLTTDCSQTFRTVYKKWGLDLLTTGYPNNPLIPQPAVTDGFKPEPNQWRTEYVDISKYVPANSTFQVVFRVTSNNGNNTLLDNININSVILPARLKANGHLLLPNPFSSTLTVRHIMPPTNLKGIVVMNAIGQVVFKQSFSGNASNYEYIDLSRCSSGVYMLTLLYTDKSITEKIIKR